MTKARDLTIRSDGLQHEYSRLARRTGGRRSYFCIEMPMAIHCIANPIDGDGDCIWKIVSKYVERKVKKEIDGMNWWKFSTPSSIQIGISVSQGTFCDFIHLEPHS